MKELSLNNCRIDRRYDILELLGRGSYSEVFLAKDILASPGSPHQNVVLKALNVFLQDDLDSDLERTLVENFQNEAVALDRVRHPNVISRLGHGTARDLRGSVFHYLVLEYLAGGDLHGRIRKERIALDAAIEYIEQVCAGLAHAHKKGIIHRDIKPQNLLLTADLSTVKIADFGVARIESAETPITRVGTNIYAPPEHSPLTAVRHGADVATRLTPAADIYSLAKTCYSLITGESPRAFANSTIDSLPQAFGSASGNALLEVLSRATLSDPGQRYQTVEEFWVAISSIRSEADGGDVSESSGPQPHISRGYTPLAPELPNFDPVTETVARKHTNALTMPLILREPGFPTSDPPANSASPKNGPAPVETMEPRAMNAKRPFIKRAAIFIVFLGLFAGILYGTASYMRSTDMFAVLRDSFSSRTGVANTDIYLRNEPNTDNDPIGLVTKNSRVRIVKSQNNWYQVDVVQQGRDRPGVTDAKRGWLNGRYLDLSEN